MGRLRDLGWWLREHAGVIALVLALVACGAGAAGIVIAMGAKDDAEDAAALAASTTATTAPTPDEAVLSTVEELNERVAAIEESVAQLRTEGEGTTQTTTGETTTPDTTTPELPQGAEIPEGIELPEGVELPGAGSPESEAPKP